MSYKISSYYMGSTSVTGFQTHFDKQIIKDGYFTFIIKGGAGTGKSTLMKKILHEFTNKDDIDVYFCSSDPNSLDAVVLKNHKFIIVDGTSPHVFDPIYPGVMQKIVNLGECWDEKKLLKNAMEIVNTIDENGKLHKRARRFVSAVSSLFYDTYVIAEEAINKTKLNSFIERLSKKIFEKSKEFSRTPHFAQISALTIHGYKTLYDTLENYTNIYIVDDEYFAGSDLLLREISRIALSKGYKLIISENSLFPEKIYEHILIPELDLAFVTRTPINNIVTNSTKVINFQRFYDREAISLRKQRLTFNKKASADLLNEAAITLNKAKKVHDEIEDFYINAMDFSNVDAMMNQIIEEIKSVEK